MGAIETDPRMEAIDAAVDQLVKDNPHPGLSGRHQAWRECVSRALFRAKERGLTKKEMQLVTKLKPTQVNVAVQHLREMGRVENASRWAYRWVKR